MSLRSHLNPKRLNDRGRFERNYRTRTAGTGASQDDWRTVVDDCPMAVDGAKASSPEPLVDGGVRTPRPYTIWVRSDIITRFAITPLDRIVWGARILNILDIPDQGLRGRFQPITAQAGLNSG